jgi:transposase
MDSEDDLMLRLLRWRCSEDTPVEESDASSTDNADSDDDENGMQRLAANGRRRVYTNAFKLRLVEAVKNGASVTILANTYKVRCPSSIHAWVKLKPKLREACSGNRGSKVSLGGQGRPPMFENEDDVRQWIKDMRREDFLLKTTHVIEYLKEEFEDWSSGYLRAKNEASLHRLVRRMVRRNGYSFRKPSQSLLSAAELLQEHVAFTSTVGVAAMATYARGCILNADETGVYFDESPGLII